MIIAIKINHNYLQLIGSKLLNTTCTPDLRLGTNAAMYFPNYFVWSDTSSL